MPKRRFLLAVSLVILTLIAGCRGPKTVQAEPNTPEPNQTETSKAESHAPDANQAPPVEPNDVKPPRPEPNQVEPAIAEPKKIDANDAEAVSTEPNDPNAGPAVSFHDKCAPIFKRFVNDNGMVDYKTLGRKRTELRALLDEFDELEHNEYKTWPEQDKIAFWINAYNIKMLDIIVSNYPIKPISRFHSVLWGPKSVRHIENKWTKYKFLVMDEVFTLSEIEKRFFRGEFNEPRVFVALTRASLSSPPLRNEPYYGHKLNEQLNDQARKFLAKPLAFKIDKEKGKVYLSALFQKIEYANEFIARYGTDKKFKDKERATQAVLNFITNYVSEEQASFLEVGNYTVQFMGYNWTINERP